MIKNLSQLFFSLLLFTYVSANAVETNYYISFKNVSGAFPLVQNGKVANLVISDNDWAGVARAFKDFNKDIKAVSGLQADLLGEIPQKSDGLLVIAGTIGHNRLIDELIKKKKIDASEVSGKWESTLIQVIENPYKGIKKALVIAGSDKRGTIYGIYTLSAQIGVSPWYWWADVPVKKHNEIYVLPGKHIINEPAVKYRGIFLNDEAPALTGWAKEKFGGLNHNFYEKVFELILRLKGNYLWPAMWGNAFNDDDKLNPVLADEYGIVMGTSHHEPMQRSQQEWKRYGKGDWNYLTNDSVLREFWRNGIKNMGNKESIVTLAMRGDGDEPMTEGTATELLERIVKDQRKIIADVTGKPASETPQLWALYKEVQDYYDKGMRVPDDVTLLLCDDNWGNIRKLPHLDAKPRKGGYGIYYHFDYVGGPRSYKWLNTNPISKVREQMNLAHKYGANEIWIVNVGDLKPVEFPIEFFLDYAWNPDKWPADKIQDYTETWASAQFGPQYAKEIAEVIDGYTKINGRRKPELLSSTSFSLVNYNEFENIVDSYNNLEQKALQIEAELPQEYKDAFFELVLHPVQACANLNEMYYNVAKNHLYAAQKRSATNATAEKVKLLFQRDKAISLRYNKETAGGKWNHMMDQTHISYKSWAEPREDVIPETKTIAIANEPDFGIALEGQKNDVTLNTSSKSQLNFDFNNQNSYIDIFNKSSLDFNYTIDIKEKWLKVDKTAGKITDEKRIRLITDWAKIPVGKHLVPIKISALGKSFMVYASVNKASSNLENKPNYLPANSYLSLDAENFTVAYPKDNWQILPHYGRTNSGVTAVPVTMPSAELKTNSPHLTYKINCQDTGLVKLKLYLSPTIDFLDKGGLLYAVSFDDEKPQIINLNEKDNIRMYARDPLLANNIKEMSLSHRFAKGGSHKVKFWRIDPGVVLQKLVIDSGGLKDSYLGAPVTSTKKL
ncbi:MAG TPA: glycosyl hydrolase 115 family protein [Pelobium sp.]|nr:glycosyl hydrolase 115 family protein [Pelobium sp.]